MIRRGKQILPKQNNLFAYAPIPPLFYKGNWGVPKYNLSYKGRLDTSVAANLHVLTYRFYLSA